MIPVEDRQLLKSFVAESMEQLGEAAATIHSHILEPDRSALTGEAAAQCFRVFRTIKGTAGFLRLDNIEAPAAACELLLNRFRTGKMTMQPAHASLLAEVCRFLTRSLQLVLEENSDARLALPAAELTAAVRREVLDGAMAEGEMGTAADISSPEMQEALIWETDEMLEAIEQEFVLWEYVAIDQDRILELVRLVHRIGRGVALFGLGDLQRLAEAMESSLLRYQNGEVFQGEYPDRVFIRAVDTMRDALVRFARSGDAGIEDLQEQLVNLQSLLHQPIGELLIKAGLLGSADIERALLVQEEERSRQQDARRLGEVLVQMGEVTGDQVSDMLARQQSIREATTHRLKTPKPAVTTTLETPRANLPRRDIPVDLHRIRRLKGLLHRLGALDSTSPQVRHLVEELIELGQTLTLIRVDTVVPRLKRIVHDLAFRFDRKVHFRIFGVNETIERETLEILTDPLLHLLRNGIQHGLEPMEERKRLGKGITGKLTLSILQRSEDIWASVEDDGRGLDLVEIGRRARKAKLLEQASLEQLDSSELAELLFRLSYVQAGNIEDTAGRVVGMETVHRSMERLNGKVDVMSKPGKGTRVTLRVPRQQPVPGTE